MSFSGGKKIGLGLQARAVHRTRIGSPAGLHRGSKDFHSQDRQKVKEQDKQLVKPPMFPELGFSLHPSNLKIQSVRVLQK